MKGRIKRTNQTIKTNKIILNKQKDEIEKTTQVLQVSKVKFASPVGVHLLTSFCICLWFSHSSRPYCLILMGEKSLLLILNLPIWFCMSSWILQTEGVGLLFYPFLWC